MNKIKITGGIPLRGKVFISGSKNAALPLMAASLLTEGTLQLSNLPHIADISTMANLLVQHGTVLTLDGSTSNSGHSGDVMQLNSADISSLVAPYDIVRTMRASVLVLAPLLARFGEAKVSLPGGCAIGSRPIDMHLKALTQMGAEIELEEGYIHAKVKKRLKGADIGFEKVSVGATENLLMAATLAEGTTTLRNAAKEPEVTDLAHCLVQMGAHIEGIGSDTLIIEGKKSLKGTNYSVIPDRIEAGTYMMAAAITGGDIEVCDIDKESMLATIEKLTETGINIELTGSHSLRVWCNGKLKGTNLITQPYPGFATDLQAQFMALMTLAEGTSVITETIFENRFMHASELIRMGANIMIDGHTAVVKGVSALKGAPLMATDLRASVSLVIAALAAEGETIINRMYHIDRGYERVEEKLVACGAKIERLG
jgi:UDP-N-acetylglucosamine 1-carboxyvinyltransferase